MIQKIYGLFQRTENDNQNLSCFLNMAESQWRASEALIHHIKSTLLLTIALTLY